MRLIATVALVTLAFAGCGDKVKFQPQLDAGPVCLDGESLVDGVCRFVCQRDGDCATGQRCNLFTGACEPKPPEPDAGPAHVPCTEGAQRCSSDGHSVELCGAEGTWTQQQACALPDGYCKNEQCLACQPGLKRCGAGNGSVEICTDDGSAFRRVTCSTGFSCVQNECRECSPGQKRCSPDGKSVQECQHHGDEASAWAFTNAGDNFDATCITQVCELGTGGVAQCKAPACVPGAAQCATTAVQQTCSATGAWVNTTCASVPGLGSSAECVSGACVDECGDAVKAKSYFGCEFWTAVLDNGADFKFYKGNVSSGQGALGQDSQFAFVVANRSNVASTVTVQRYFGGALQTVKTINVPGRSDPVSKGVAVIKVPWQSIGADSDQITISGLKRYGYHLTTTHPVTVYQFNPLDALVPTAKSCSGTAGAPDCSCDEGSNFNWLTCGGSGVCSATGKCQYPSYSNDASLLLPAHILGTAYVGLTMEHVMMRSSSTSSTPSVEFNGALTIVGTQDGTSVTVKASAATLANGAAVPAMAKGGTHVFTLNSYDVLQLASDNPSPATNLECGTNPYSGSGYFCRADSDLTGSIITSDKPVALFGGANCANRGYLDTACDHVEEQLFPFATWGKSFVGARTNPLRLVSGAIASPSVAGPDYYKIVAGCPSTTCPTGTLVTISPAPAAGDVLSPNRCLTGSLAAGTCKLAGGAFVEFKTKSSVVITADQPVLAAQIFASQNATAGSGSSAPDQGDPSLVLLPPIEQWRTSYTVLTAPGIKDNYLGIVLDDTKVDSVTVNNNTIPATNSAFVKLGTSPYRVANLPVPVGTHTIVVNSKPGQNPLPGVGVTVYGFDSYVSYGYTGGLDLSTIVTGINPGG